MNNHQKETPLILVGGHSMHRVLRIQELIKKYKKQNKKIGVLSSIETKKFYEQADFVLILGSKKNLEAVSKNICHEIQKLNKMGVDIILAETFPAKEINGDKLCP